MKEDNRARLGLEFLKGPGSNLWIILLLTCFSLLSGCAPQQRVNAPVYRPEQRQPTPESTMQQPSGQTANLLAEAEQALNAGHADRAEMQLERAIRLSPGDALLWQMMARIRLAQDNPSQAVQFCLKSNSLAGGDTALLRRNWLLLETAYLAAGNSQKAAMARQKADELP